MGMKFILSWDGFFFSPQLKHMNLPLCFPDRKLTLFKSILGLIPDLLHPLLLDFQNCFMPRCSLWNLTSIYILCTLTSCFFHIKPPASQITGFAAVSFPILLSNLPEQREKQRNLTSQNRCKCLKARVASEP